MKAKNLMFAMLAAVTFMFASCMADDVYNPDRIENDLKEEYSKNFFKEFGEVPADYSWDAAATFADKSGDAFTRAASTTKYVRNATYTVKQTAAQSINETPLTWIRTNLPANNRGIVDGLTTTSAHKYGAAVYAGLTDLEVQARYTNYGVKLDGQPFFFVIPDGEFTVLPIYQGSCSHNYEFCIMIEGVKEPIRVFKRSNAIESTTKNTNVQAKGYTFDLSAHKGKLAYFYCLRLNWDETESIKGTMYSPLNRCMATIPESVRTSPEWACPIDLPTGYEYEVIATGCDGYIYGITDSSDVEDLVFMVYGEDITLDYVPRENVTGKQEQIQGWLYKRYMVEDLGSTDDFDFNDLVIDLKGAFHAIEVGPTVSGRTFSQPVMMNIAKIAFKATHLGGQLNFNVDFGSYNTKTYPVSAQMMGDDVETTDDYTSLKFFNPFVNSIYVSVAGRGDNGNEVYEIEFPNDGEAPLMISVSNGAKWMKERVSIDSNWFGKLKEGAEILNDANNKYYSDQIDDAAYGKLLENYYSKVQEANTYRDAMVRE